MQRTITVHGIDFEVEFSQDATIDAVYIGATEVMDVLCEKTMDEIRFVVESCVDVWFSEYHVQLEAEAKRERKAC